MYFFNSTEVLIHFQVPGHFYFSLCVLFISLYLQNRGLVYLVSWPRYLPVVCSGIPGN